ncbi:DUF262 domain-containing protein [Streptomyces graminilatus]|uniref:DUF262 domain-containing protein n=1 Tax=Streptomyces graminilatus TaxID=1464070 RepID=UPI0006E23EAC|nr:DUF262 domain-containing protein [Streptomyces graminilatus]
MSRQTAAPVKHTVLTLSAREAVDLVRLVAEGQIDLSPPYQRGPVWSGDQRVALVRSWLTGLPAGVVVLSSRENPQWTAASGDVYEAGLAPWAVVDGKQRILTAQAWFTSAFAVPATWFDPTHVVQSEETDDGPYVRHDGLSEAGRLKFERRAVLQVTQFKSAASVADEAAMYVLVNGGGTPQTAQDMERAHGIAGPTP